MRRGAARQGRGGDGAHGACVGGGDARNSSWALTSSPGRRVIFSVNLFQDGDRSTVTSQDVDKSAGMGSRRIVCGLIRWMGRVGCG